MLETKEKFGELFQAADWTKEKHVPAIDAPDTAKKGEMFAVNVAIGRQVTHPNTTQHHIQWVDLYFHPDGETFPYCIGRCEFQAHGSSAKGADSSTVYTHHEVTFKFKTDVPGTIFASSYCNIHGLWQSSKRLDIA